MRKILIDGICHLDVWTFSYEKGSFYADAAVLIVAVSDNFH